jgi:hypothetical protein
MPGHPEHHVALLPQLLLHLVLQVRAEHQEGHRGHRQRDRGDRARGGQGEPGAQHQRAERAARTSRPSRPVTGGPDHVAHAPHVVQEPGTAPVLELAPQEADEHLQRVGRGRLAVAPHPLPDHVVADHLLGVAQQQLEQAELGPGQLDHPVAAGQPAGGDVEGQVGVPEHVPADPAAPEQGLDPGQQLSQGKRLDQVVVGPGGEPGHPVVHGVPGGEHQDGGGVSAGTEPAARVEPVDHGHQHVHDDQVDRRAGQRVERVRAMDRGGHRVSGAAQRAFQRNPDIRVVVHDQEPLAAQRGGNILPGTFGLHSCYRIKSG